MVFPDLPHCVKSKRVANWSDSLAHWQSPRVLKIVARDGHKSTGRRLPVFSIEYWVCQPHSIISTPYTPTKDRISAYKDVRLRMSAHECNDYKLSSEQSTAMSLSNHGKGDNWTVIKLLWLGCNGVIISLCPQCDKPQSSEGRICSPSCQWKDERIIFRRSSLLDHGTSQEMFWNARSFPTPTLMTMQ